MQTQDLIKVENLKVFFKQRKENMFSLKPNYLKAVDGVSFSIQKGETFGLVGESGSGKSTIGKSILKYYPITEGKIFFEGVDIERQKEKEFLPFRKKMQSIFQDPYVSLDPKQTVLKIICEPMEIHQIYTKEERREKARQMIEMVGLKQSDLLKYPHEFSGGQRQRISIARALSIEPSFVICDEPVSALDVSLQRQVIKLLQDFQEKWGLTYLFISHQLQVVHEICSHIGVMCLGNLFEIAPSKSLYENPLHPYTKMLMNSILEANPKKKNLENIKINFGIQTREERGCKFYSRCPNAMKKCAEKVPDFAEVKDSHFVACYLYE